MIKLLSCRSQQCLGPFTLLLFEGSSETRLFRQLSNHVFCSSKFSKYISYEGHLFFKMFKFSSRFLKCRKKCGKFFCFLDKFIWIGSVKLTVFRTEFLSSVMNVLTNSPKVLLISKRDFSKLKFLHSDE